MDWLQSIRIDALEMKHHSSFDVVVYIWFNWIKSSMFCRFAKEDEPLSEMEHPTHWMLGKYFVINVLFNKVWIMVLPSLMLTFSVEVSLGVKFITKLSLVALGLDIVILIIAVGAYLPLCHKLFHVLPLTYFSAAFRRLEWDKYINDLDYSRIVDHVHEICDVLFMEKERQKMVYECLDIDENVASVIVQFAESKVEQLSFLRSQHRV